MPGFGCFCLGEAAPTPAPAEQRPWPRCGQGGCRDGPAASCPCLVGHSPFSGGTSGSWSRVLWGEGLALGCSPHTAGSSLPPGPRSLQERWLYCLQVPGRPPACGPHAARKQPGDAQCWLPSCRTAQQHRRQAGLSLWGCFVVRSPFPARESSYWPQCPCAPTALQGQHKCCGSTARELRLHLSTKVAFLARL